MKRYFTHQAAANQIDEREQSTKECKNHVYIYIYVHTRENRKGREREREKGENRATW